ncbi:MAG: hypothetical protein EOP82_18325 [Variovorax sp.]|nr:MAG: hypothetical protein EOP82_18325 [Variovorax sp.]
MRKWLVLFCAMGAAAQAQTPWFTVTGNPQDATVNTVQVDPVAITTRNDVKTMNVRVSRSRDRVNWDGVPYRSYEAQVVFDCRARKAGYLAATYYLQPLWQGPANKTSVYGSNPRPMLFRDVEPNPTDRLIRAACRSDAR